MYTTNTHTQKYTNIYDKDINKLDGWVTATASTTAGPTTKIQIINNTNNIETITKNNSLPRPLEFLPYCISDKWF